MNRIILVGRLIKDPDVRQSQSGTSVARFTVAVDRKRKNKETGQREADFIDCVAFGFSADFLKQWFHKGDPIEVEGSLRNNNYEKDGIKHYSYTVFVDDASFVPHPKAVPQVSSEDFAKDAESKGVPVKKVGKEELPENLDGFEEIIGDGDVPF